MHFHSCRYLTNLAFIRNPFITAIFATQGLHTCRWRALFLFLGVGAAPSVRCFRSKSDLKRKHFTCIVILARLSSRK
eukprot:COSAG02_NODE_51019_length_317_cov_0.545872_1_plen_76_part_10